MSNEFDVSSSFRSFGTIRRDRDGYKYFENGGKVSEIRPAGTGTYNIFSFGEKTGALVQRSDRLEVFDLDRKTHDLMFRGDHYDVYEGSRKVGEIRPTGGPDLVDRAFEGIGAGIGALLGALLESKSKPANRSLPIDRSEPLLDRSVYTSARPRTTLNNPSRDTSRSQIPFFKATDRSAWMSIEWEIESGQMTAIVHDPYHGTAYGDWHVFIRGRSRDWCSSYESALESLTSMLKQEGI